MGDTMIMPGLHRACWDCEALIGGGVFCASCAEHREDGHAPRATFTDVPTHRASSGDALEAPRAEFCHGAGPLGYAYALLEQLPQEIVIDRPYKSPTTERLAA